MTREDIIREADEWLRMNGKSCRPPHYDLMVLFSQHIAALVLADERNRVWTQDHWTEYEHAIAAAEREACARIAEEPSATTYECTVACGGPAQTFMQRMPKDAHEIAKQIRARGQA